MATMGNENALKELLQTQINSLRDLVFTQFAEREKLHDASLDGVTKQIEPLETRLDKISDRLTIIESKTAGHTETWGYIAAIIGLIFSGLVAFGIYAAR